MEQLPDALAPLAAYRQWVLWRAAPSTTRPGKTDKFPIDPRTGKVASAHDPAIWLDAPTAISTAAAWGEAFGAGFVLTEADPFFFLDIDDCAMPAGWAPLALELCGRLNGAAIEVSRSGKGLHVIGVGTPPAHRSKPPREVVEAIQAQAPGVSIEFYHAGRFVALTGINAVGSAAVDCSAALPQLVADYFPPLETVAGEEWTEGPRADWNGPEDDERLLAKMLASGSAGATFGGRATFRDLFECNVDILAACYPDENRAYDASKADAALAQHLAFWTGSDCPRMLRLMQRSELVRDKWTQHATYLYRTITRAVSLQRDVYNAGGRQRDESHEPPTSVQPQAPMGTAAGPEVVAGLQYLAATQQIEHFAGCVYVRDRHRVLTPDGSLLKAEQFRAMYGGYLFALDATNDKTTKNAWEAFTESQAVRYPKVADTMFRPDLPPGELIEFNGQRLVNSYVAIDVPRQAGDPSPFLDHLARVLPDENDRAILLAYMAACVQHKGVKFQWAPLIQGVEGNGKTLFSRVVAEAVGMRHVHTPKASEISTKFNSWVRDKVFIYVEDVYLPDGKREVFEALKPLVTNDWQPVEPKGVDQVTAYVTANFMLNSNHKDAIRKTRNDRRFAVFYTAQQDEADITRDGMAGDYFPRLYGWLKRQGGYAIVAEYLATYPIPDELNPAGLCHRAPKTSSTEEAIAQSMGSVEQEVQEAIDEGRPGFCGGWVSSMSLDRLLDQLRAARAIPPGKRRDLMRSLGYDWHPGLKDGRVNNVAQPDGGKPRLFIREGHIHRNLTSPAEIARHYSEAQGAAAVGVAPAIEVFGGNRQ